MDILLDARQLETREDAHPYLKKMLSFPEYYGGTLDSLHDCLTEMGRTRIRFLSLPEKKGGYLGRILRVFEDAAEENERLTVITEQYKLIALDMDGTVLDDEKVIRPETAQAIRDALQAGREVVFCTGRNLMEMTEYLEMFPDMHYLVGESGGLIMDLRKQEILHLEGLPKETVQMLHSVSAGRDIMPHAFCRGIGWMNRSQQMRAAHYQMEPFQELFEKTAEATEDLFGMILAEGLNTEKLNLYHTSPKEREITRERLLAAGTQAEMVDANISALEFSPAGVSKGSGLKNLAGLLGISTDEIIMVGDAPNDMEGLKTAGFAVAMGNAPEDVKEICDTVVADNNHDGCAEAIRRFLL